MNPTQREAALSACEPLMRRIANKWASSDLPFEDAMQEARLAVWEALALYEGRYPLWPFVATVTRNRLYDLSCKRKALLMVPILSREESDRGYVGIGAHQLPYTEDGFTRANGQTWVEDAIGRITNLRCRQAVAMTVQGQPNKAVAHALYGDAGKVGCAHSFYKEGIKVLRGYVRDGQL